MSFIWHRFNLDKSQRKKQCYYEWHCLVCWVGTLVFIIKTVFSKGLRTKTK